MSKRNEGRDETVLEPDLPIIDTHHHLFDRPALRYMLDDYLVDVALGHRIIASVYVETQAMARPDGPDWLRPLGEVEFANGVAAVSASGTYGACRVAAGIVGYADLSLGERVGELLDRCIAAAPDRFRGVRQITMDHPSEAAFRFLTNRPARGIMERPGFRLGFHELGKRGLSFDACVFHTQLAALGALADAHPDTTIVLNHLGLALAMDMPADARAEVFHAWRSRATGNWRGVRAWSAKIGGLGTAYWGFGFNERTNEVGSAELAVKRGGPYVETAIEAFGADALHDGEQFSARRPIVRFRAVVERDETDRAGVFDRREGGAVP